MFSNKKFSNQTVFKLSVFILPLLATSTLLHARIKTQKKTIKPEIYNATIEDGTPKFLLPRNSDSEEKEEFLEGIDKKTLWEMGEDKPKQGTDITSGGEKLSPLLIKFIDEDSRDTEGV
jgi:hypothetical protein